MTQQFPCSNTQFDKIMNPEQFEQVVEAILSGKYSWACFLILRFAGYNPVHYIPYRTYKRLIKENNQGRASKRKIDNLTTSKKGFETRSNNTPSQSGLSDIYNSSCSAILNEQKIKIYHGS